MSVTRLARLQETTRFNDPLKNNHKMDLARQLLATAYFGSAQVV
jgi:hypothetical protein